MKIEKAKLMPELQELIEQTEAMLSEPDWPEELREQMKGTLGAYQAMKFNLSRTDTLRGLDQGDE